MADAKSESEFDKRLISTTFTTICIKSGEHSVACGHSVNPTVSLPVAPRRLTLLLVRIPSVLGLG